MLALGKKIDYALISLVHLAEEPMRYISAREIAEANGLPLPALMQILKSMHHHGVLRSTRGVKGGYQIEADLEKLSLHALSEMLETEGPAADGSVDRHPPVEAMRQKLSQFLRGVRVAEVVRYGGRIDVPLQNLRIIERIVDRALEDQSLADVNVRVKERRTAETAVPASI